MEKVHVWVTKYALTSGIFECDAEICSDVSTDMIRIKRNHFDEYFHKNEWYTSKLDAIVRAEEMKEKKINSLNKQLNKISNINFDMI